MIIRRTLLKSATALVALSLSAPVLAQSDEPTRVVASFSIIGDMAARIGGDHISLETIVGPNGDPHVYQPTPAAARAVSEAQVLIVNGLEFEGWLDRLIDASGFDGTKVIATNGIDPISYDDDHDKAEHDDHDHDKDEHDDHDHDKDEHDDHDHDKDEHDDHDHDKDEHDDHDHDKDEHDDHDHDKDEHDDHGHDKDAHDAAHADHHHGDEDPHAWLSLTNAVLYVDNITAAFAQADPSNAATFYQNRAEYVSEIEALDEEIRSILGEIPQDNRTVVTSHDAFQYFARDYGLTFVAPQGLSTESEASAKDVAALIEKMRKENVSAVFVENISDSRLLEQIANETGATIGGELFPGALSEPDGPASTYLDLMRHNAMTLAQALNPQGQ